MAKHTDEGTAADAVRQFRQDDLASASAKWDRVAAAVEADVRSEQEIEEGLLAQLGLNPGGGPDPTDNLRLSRLHPPARKRAKALIAGAREAREVRAAQPSAPEDGPAAQAEYDQTPELRELLAAAAASQPTKRTASQEQALARIRAAAPADRVSPRGAKLTLEEACDRLGLDTGRIRTLAEEGRRAVLLSPEVYAEYVDEPDDFVDVDDELDPEDRAMLLARLADPSPGIPLDEVIRELGFDPLDFRGSPHPPARVWLLYDAGDLVAAYSTEAAAETARKVYAARVQAELDAEDPPPAVAMVVYHYIEVCPIEVRD